MRRGLRFGSAAALAGGFWPAAASGHALSGAPQQPVPDFAVAFNVALILVLSIALLRMQRRPRQDREPQATLGRVSPAALEVLRVAALVAFVLVVLCGLLGDQYAARNLLPTAVWGWTFVGVALASMIVSGIFPWLSPWRTVAGWLDRLWIVGWLRAPSGYPARLQSWPAALGMLGIAWVELGWSGGGQPRSLAIAVLVYGGAQVLGMLRYGIEPWQERADGLAVMFALFGAVAPLAVGRDGSLRRRRTLSALQRRQWTTSSRLVACVLVAVPVYDGARQTASWAHAHRAVVSQAVDWGVSPGGAREAAATLELLLVVALIVGVAGAVSRWLGAGRAGGAARDAVACAMVPVALGFFLAHNVSLALLTIQSTPRLLADPAGQGWDLLGARSVPVDYALLSAAGVWLVQLCLLVAGHVAALVAGYRRMASGGSVGFSDTPLTALAVTLTGVALWLLSQAGNVHG